MQRALDRASLGRRNELRPRQIGFEKLVGDQQPAAVVAVEQMVAAGDPEVVHLRSRPAMETRSTEFAWLFILALDVHEREGARRLCPFARAQRAERFAYGTLVIRAVHRDQRVLRLIAQRFGERDFVLRRGARGLPVRRAELIQQPLRQCLDQCGALGGIGLDDLHQRRPAEGLDAEEAAAKRGARFAFERRRIAVPEHEGAGYRPLARLGRVFENESVRGVEPDGAQ